MRTSHTIFSTPAPKPRLREFFANSWVLVGPAERPRIPFKSQPARVKYTDVPRGRVPGRGLLYSFLAHEMAIFAILTASTAIQLSWTYRHTQEIWRMPEKKLTYILPELGGGSSGEAPAPAKPADKAPAGLKAAPRTETASASPEKPAPPLAAPLKPGLVYPAAQPIVSNPPNPTNRVQTIMRPELANPPTLKVPLALPNMVMIARATPRPSFAPRVTAPPAPAKTPSAPALGPEQHPLGWHFVNVALREPLPTPPQLALPEISSHKFTPLPQNPSTQVPKVTRAASPATPEAEALKPELAENVAPAIPGVRERINAVPKVSVRSSSEGTTGPATAELRPEFGGGTDERSVLVLSPTPGPPTPNPSIPRGEARGQFAMGPEPNLNAPPGSGIGLGVPGGTGTSPTGSSTAEGGATNATTGGKPGGKGAGAGTSLTAGSGEGGSSGSGNGSGTSAGSGTGTGGGGTGVATSGTGTGAGIGGGAGNGSGLGAGAGTGKGSGTGIGTGTGPGTGAGTGPGTSPFSGITITGGSGGGVAARPPAPATKTPPATHGSYGMSIVATASSGGGLRDYGIFRNETAYTVYIDRSQAAAPSWTLEYAQAMTPAPDPMVSSLKLSGSSDAQTQLTPPYPMDEEDPQFPPDVVARNPGRLIVITGVLGPDGKFTKLRIIQSPNPQLNAPALEALSKWSFRPAERAGAPVTLKILLGIPLPSASQ